MSVRVGRKAQNFVRKLCLNMAMATIWRPKEMTRSQTQLIGPGAAAAVVEEAEWKTIPLEIMGGVAHVATNVAREALVEPVAERTALTPIRRMRDVSVATYGEH